MNNFIFLDVASREVCDMKWVGDRFDITLGDTQLELHHAGVSHGNGMTTFVLPKEKVESFKYL